MKFICQKDSLLSEISNSSDFVAQKSNATILSNVCLVVTDNILTVKTTDQKTGYISETNIEGLENGSISVSCDKFLEIIKNMPSGNLIIENKNDTVYIKPEDSEIEFNLRTADPAAFPPISIPSEENFFRIAQKDFTDMINQVSFAVSDDESKFAMNGALFEKDDNSLVMVGTDGRRLSYIKRHILNEVPEFGKVTVPAKFLSIIRKHSVNEGDFGICVSENSIYIRSGSCVIFSNLIKNEFPAYKRVIPEHQSFNCTVEIKALDDAIRRASLLVVNKFKKIILEFNDNKITVSSEVSDVGSGKEVIPCNYNGEPLKCAMNYTYLLSPLKVMDGNEVKISFTDNSRPFTVTSNPERDYLHVIMPMNI